MGGIVTLLGNFHPDPEMETRLTAALMQERPRCITTESCPGDAEFMWKRMRKLHRDLRLSRLREDQRSLYVHLVQSLVQSIYLPEEFGRRHGIPTHPIDAPFMSPYRRKPDDVQESTRRLFLGWVDRYTQIELQQMHDNGYLEMEDALGRGDVEWQRRRFACDDPAAVARVDERDTYACGRIMELLGEHDHVHHVCGADHMLDDERTLYAKLRQRGVRVIRRTTRQYGFDLWNY